MPVRRCMYAAISPSLLLTTPWSCIGTSGYVCVYVYVYVRERIRWSVRRDPIRSNTLAAHILVVFARERVLIVSLTYLFNLKFEFLDFFLIFLSPITLMHRLPPPLFDTQVDALLILINSALILQCISTVANGFPCHNIDSGQSRKKSQSVSSLLRARARARACDGGDNMFLDIT